MNVSENEIGTHTEGERGGVCTEIGSFLAKYLWKWQSAPRTKTWHSWIIMTWMEVKTIYFVVTLSSFCSLKSFDHVNWSWHYIRFAYGMIVGYATERFRFLLFSIDSSETKMPLFREKLGMWDEMNVNFVWPRAIMFGSMALITNSWCDSNDMHWFIANYRSIKCGVLETVCYN